METTAGKVSVGQLVRQKERAPLSLTERDKAIFLQLSQSRFMHTGQLQTLFGRRIYRRLCTLFDHGYVDRPNAQWVWRRREEGGSRPRVYALGNLGARVLAAEGMIRAAKRDWTERNRDLSSFSFSIRHELAIADVRVAFQKACDARPGLRFISAAELTKGKRARGLVIPGREQLLYPDLIFAIEREGGEPSLFFVEADRESEPNEREFPEMLEDLRWKYERYLAYARAKRQVEQFGVANFRVLTITTGKGIKVANVAKTAGKVCDGVGCGRFLVSNFEALERSDPFEAAWFDASGTAVCLGA